MSIIALDYGDARIGVAVSDPMGIMVASSITLNNNSSFIKELEEIVNQRSVKTIVVGLPLNMNGTVGQRAIITKKFITGLKASSKILENIPFEFLDERMTTMQASEVLKGSKLKNKKKSAKLDEISASIILQTFLEKQRNKIL